jgi:Fe(3+) dicitrate transport protein
MRTRAGQGPYLPEESIDSHLIVDFVAAYNLTQNLATYVKIDNLLDETYVAARRPAGVRPGLPRTAYVGITYRL